MKLYGIKDASDILIKDIVTKEPVLFIDYAQKAGINIESSTVYAQAKGSNRISWKGETTGTLTLETQLMDSKLLALMLGAEIVTAQKDVGFKKKVRVPADTKTITLDFDPVENSVSVAMVDGEREFLKVGKENPSTTNVKIDGKTITFHDDHAGQVVYIFGLKEEQNAKSFKVNINDSSKAFEARMFTEVTLDTDNSQKFAQIDLFKIKPKESTSFEFGSSDASTFSLEFDILQDASGDLLEMVELS